MALILMPLVFITVEAPPCLAAASPGSSQNPVEIHILADGSINPANVYFTQIGETYTFTDVIHGWIVVEKDNVLIDGAGYPLVGKGSGKSECGITLSGRSNVTVRKSGTCR